MIGPALAVARREWRLQLGSALGWSVMSAFAVLAGTVFALAVFRAGAPASLRGTFIALGWAVLLVAPALSMRSVAEERRAGTWASLAASPAGFAAIVLGKFVALSALLAVTVAVPVIAQLAALEWFARPDLLEAATGFAGLSMAGCAYVASGILASALVGNQVAAYLVTVLSWLTWIAVARSVPALLPVELAPLGFAVDPLRRLDDFLLGLLDTGNAAYFAAATAWFLLAATAAAARPSLPAALAAPRRVVAGLVLAAAAAVAVVGIADAPGLRSSADMTKSRAYTLAPATRALLDGLEGDWNVAVLLASPDSAVARQVDEVLARLADASARGGRIRASRVDPSDWCDAPRDLPVWGRGQGQMCIRLARHAEAIRSGRAAFDRLAAFALTQAPLLADLVTALPESEPCRADLDALRAGFVQLAAQKRSFDRSIDELRAATDARPFPDEARAAGAIAANLKHWGEELSAAARRLAERRSRGVDDAALDAWLRSAPAELSVLARELRLAQDALDRLPRLWGAEVGAALAAGDCAIVVGPPGVAVVPGWQLVSGAATGSISFDRRFRGEQAIASAIRALRSGASPVAVFVHAGTPGVLRPSADRSDLAAAADALRAARFEVREWIPGEGAQPAAGAGRPVVWIIVPPTDRDGAGDSPRERELLSAARRLVGQGEPVLLSVGPSLLPLLGQQDPWAGLLSARGLAARTGRTLLELVPTGPDRAEAVASQTTASADPSSPIGRAVDGQRVRLDRPVPLEPGDAAIGVIAIEPSSARWVEDDWRRDVRVRTEAPRGKRLERPLPVVLASESPGPAGRTARAVLVGSPTWMSTAVADAADPIGGGRTALRNPGNRDLLVNAVAWLSGREDLMSGGTSGREIGRLPALSRAQVAAVGTLEAFVLPAIVAAAGTVVVLRRRLRT